MSAFTSSGEQSAVTNSPTTSDDSPQPELNGWGAPPSAETYGPEFFEIRRRAFLSGNLFPSQHYQVSDPSETDSQPRLEDLDPSKLSNMQRLELMLREPGVEQLDVTWKKHGLEVVSNLLNQGKALKERMKLSVLIKILRAGWVRDGTWPSTTTPSGRRAMQALVDDPFFDSPPLPPTATSTTTTTNKKKKQSADGQRPEQASEPETLKLDN